MNSVSISKQVNSVDPEELQEWKDSFASVISHAGVDQAKAILDELAAMARTPSLGWRPNLRTPYINTVSVDNEPDFPGDLTIEERLASIMRWNALAMVVRANRAYGELGGHIASYASAADLFEVGFNLFLSRQQ
jgi:Pyruvate dehydrogenase complex, dehydrogenase (E1) component